MGTYFATSFTGTCVLNLFAFVFALLLINRLYNKKPQCIETELTDTLNWFYISLNYLFEGSEVRQR